MHIKRRQDINWLDLPKIESPVFAKSWIEQNINVNVNLNGFGVQWVRGLGDVLGSDLEPLRGGKALDCHARARLLEKIERCEVFLVHELGSAPFVPVVRPGQGNNTWLVDKSLSLDAQFNVECTISNAIQTKGSLAPPPPKPKSEPAVVASKKEEKPATGGIALLPVRYAVGRIGYGDGSYSYSNPNLKQDFPELKQARYVLRTLRSGFVYVYFDDKLECFSVGPARLSPYGEETTGSIRANGDALIFPGGDDEKKEVMLAFSDHPWTTLQCDKIIANEAGCRDSQMQRFALDNLKQDTLPLADVATQVEEYAGVYDAQYKDWTEHPSYGRHEAASRVSKLESIAGTGQHVVVLYDPVGITHELTNLVERDLGDLRSYTTAPSDEEKQEADADARIERHRQSVIATYIERVITNQYLGRVRTTGETTDQALESLVKLRQEYRSADPVMSDTMSNSEVRKQIMSDMYKADSTSSLRTHLKRDGMEVYDFLKKYRADIKDKEKAVQARKDDRSKWLASCNKMDKPFQLGAAWSTYDMADHAQWIHYEHSFARATAGMTAIALPSSKRREESEFKLLTEWIEAPPEESPLYRALMGHEELMQTLSQNKDRLADLTDGSAKLIKEIHNKYPLTAASVEITNHVTTYVLDKVEAKKAGLTRRQIGRLENMIKTLANKGDVPGLIKVITSRAGLFAELKEERLEKVLHSINEAAKIPGGLQPAQLVSREGNLRKGTHVIKLTDATSRQTYENPFKGFGSAGVAGIVGFFNLLNLKMAWTQIEDDLNAENITNLVSAITGLTAAILEFMSAGKQAVELSTKTLSILQKGGIAGSVNRLTTRMLAGRLARAFGFIAAAFTAITDAIKAIKQMMQGEWDAGLFYVASAITAGVGTSTMIVGAGLLATNPAGWLVLLVGVLLVGVSVLFANSAERAKANALEKWLDGTIFGERELDDSTKYGNLEEEQEGLIEAMYMPEVLDSNFDVIPPENMSVFKHYFAEFDLFLPAYTEGESTVEIKPIDGPGKPVDWGTSKGTRYMAGGLMRHYEHYIPKDQYSKWSMKYAVKYRPTPEFQKPLELEFSVGLWVAS